MKDTEIKPSLATQICKYVLWTVGIWWLLLAIIALTGLTIQLLIALNSL
jgi:fatty acid desaturase